MEYNLYINLKVFAIGVKFSLGPPALSMFSTISMTGVKFNGAGTKFILIGVELPMLLLLTNGGRGVRGTPPPITLVGTFGNTAEF